MAPGWLPKEAQTYGVLLPQRDCSTIVATRTESLRFVRDNLADLVDRVEHQHERVIVTRNGHAVAVLISLVDLAQLEESIDVLSDPSALADIREADAPMRAVRWFAASLPPAGFGGSRENDFRSQAGESASLDQRHEGSSSHVRGQVVVQARPRLTKRVEAFACVGAANRTVNTMLGNVLF
jgi:antitoxin YefM